MSKINRIKSKLDVLKPHYCEIVDESSKHASHTGGTTESHFRVKIFSAAFIGKSLLEQHKMINNLLADELTSGLHALSIDTKKPNLPHRNDGKMPICMTSEDVTNSSIDYRRL